VRGSWGRRHRDVAESDLRDDRVGEPPHLGRIVDEDAGNVTLSGPGRPFSGLDRVADDALRVLGPLWGGKYTQRGGRCWTTREEDRSSRHLRDEDRLPSRNRRTPVTLRAPPAGVPPHLPHTRPSRHGHSLPGPLREGRVPTREGGRSLGRDAEEVLLGAAVVLDCPFLGVEDLSKHQFLADHRDADEQKQKHGGEIPQFRQSPSPLPDVEASRGFPDHVARILYRISG